MLLSGRSSIKAFKMLGYDTKAFCAKCGSSLFGGDWPDGDELSIRLGVLDDDSGIRPQCHTFVSSKAPWVEILDGLPQHAQALPRREQQAEEDTYGISDAL